MLQSYSTVIIKTINTSRNISAANIASQKYIWYNEVFNDKAVLQSLFKECDLLLPREQTHFD